MEAAIGVVVCVHGCMMASPCRSVLHREVSSKQHPIGDNLNPIKEQSSGVERDLSRPCSATDKFGSVLFEKELAQHVS